MTAKIAIISNSAFSLVNFRSRFIEDLANTGSEVYALAPDFTDTFRTQIEKAGAEPIDIYMDRAGQNVIKDLGSVFGLYKILKELDPDITFSYGIKPVIYGLWASRLANIENRFAMVAGLGTVYVKRDNPAFKDKVRRKVADLLYKSAFWFAERVFFQNPDDIRLFVEDNIIDQRKTTLINGSGVDIDYYRSGDGEQRTVTFTLVSRLIKEKGIYEFVASARRLQKKYPRKDMDFILLGDVDANPNSVTKFELESWVEEGIIRWPGHVTNVKEWLEKTSVFVLPTYYREGTPKSILEAMAMSLPVITTDMPGCRETVIDGENGFLISPRDVSELTKTMAKFIETPSLIASMGSKSRDMVVEKYDVRKVNKDLLTHMGLY